MLWERERRAASLPNSAHLLEVAVEAVEVAVLLLDFECSGRHLERVLVSTPDGDSWYRLCSIHDGPASGDGGMMFQCRRGAAQSNQGLHFIV